MKNKPPYCNIQIFFHTKFKVSNFFAFKDKMPPLLRLELFVNLSMIAARLAFMAKLKWEKARGDDDSAIKNYYFGFTCQIL